MSDPDEPGDEWADDPFFRAGDGGSDASGPHSLAPVAFEEEAPRPVSAAQLARRARLTRVVARTVGVLAVFAFLAPFARGLRAHRDADRAAFSVLEPARPVANGRVAPLAEPPPASVSPRAAATVQLPVNANGAVRAAAPDVATRPAPLVAMTREPPHSARLNLIRLQVAKSAATSPARVVARPALDHAAPSTPSVARFPDPS